MNQKENGELKQIAKHVTILNEELGKVKNDISWIKKLLFIIIGLISVAVGKSLFFS